MNTSRSWSYQDCVIKLIGIFALTVGAYLFLTSLYFWMNLHVHIPMQDTWHLLPLVQNVLEHGLFSTRLEDWLAPHAGAHRITITRLFMVADYRYFDGQNHTIYASAWLSIVTMLLVYVSVFRKSYRPETSLLVFIVGIALIFLSSHTQVWNLNSPINSSWYVALAASSLSISMIVNRPAAPPPLHFIAAYLLAAVAALSNFSGVIVWLLLPVFIALRNIRAGFVAALLSSLFLALYLRGISPDSAALLNSPKFIEQLHASANEKPAFLDYWLRRGTHIVTKICQYLGSPLSIDHPRLASLMVVSSCLIILAGWLKLLKQRYLNRSRLNTWLELTLAMATLCLGVAIATQIGRVMLSLPTADRYQTVVMVYWLSVCGLILFFSLESSEDKPAWRLAATTLCLCVAALFLFSSSNPMLRSANAAEAASRATVLARLGVADMAVHGHLLPRNKRDYLTEFEAFFEQTSTAYMANTTRPVNLDESTECNGVNLRAKPSKWPHILIASGTIDDHWTKWHRQIPLFSSEGNVIGGLFPVHGDTPSTKSMLIQRKGRWEGYFSTSANPNDAVYLRYRSSPFAELSCRTTM